MKLAVIGDLHLSEQSPRYPHALDLVRWVLRDATEQGARHFVFLGDIFEGAPAPDEYGEFIQLLFEALSHGGYVGICRGNHEHYKAMCFFEGLHPMLQVAWENIRSLEIEGTEILLIPYPTRYKPPYDGLDDGGTIVGSMTAAAERIAGWIKDDDGPTDVPLLRVGGLRPLIVLGHFTIEGMTTRDTEFELHQGHEVVVPLASLTRGQHLRDGEVVDVIPDLTIVGHIHRAQDLTPRVLGAGSLYRCSFAEVDDPKSYVLVTVEHGVVTHERRPVPAREMVVFEVELADLAARLPEIEAAVPLVPRLHVDPPHWTLVPAREVKVTVSMDADEAPHYDPAVFDRLKATAALCVIEKRVRPIQRTRAPALMVAKSLGEEVVAWLQATEQSVEPDRLARLIDKANALEG